MGYTADLQSATLMKKAREKVPNNFFLKWTEHTVTSIETPDTLVIFQKELEVPQHLYSKIHPENFQQNNLRRNNIKKHGNLNNSDNHASRLAIQSFGFSAQTVNQNQSTKLSSSGTAKPLSAPSFPPLRNANQMKCSCDKFQENYKIATCPDYQKCSPSQQFDIVNKSNLFSNCLSKKHRKRNCPSTKTLPNLQWVHYLTLVKLSGLRQLLLPPAITQVLLLPPEKFSQTAI